MGTNIVVPGQAVMVEMVEMGALFECRTPGIDIKIIKAVIILGYIDSFMVFRGLSVKYHSGIIGCKYTKCEVMTVCSVLVSRCQAHVWHFPGDFPVFRKFRFQIVVNLMAVKNVTKKIRCFNNHHISLFRYPLRIFLHKSIISPSQFLLTGEP